MNLDDIVEGKDFEELLKNKNKNKKLEDDLLRILKNPPTKKELENYNRWNKYEYIRINLLRDIMDLLINRIPNYILRNFITNSLNLGVDDLYSKYMKVKNYLNKRKFENE
jgi:hypothetical protein